MLNTNRTHFQCLGHEPRSAAGCAPPLQRSSPLRSKIFVTVCQKGFHRIMNTKLEYIPKLILCPLRRKKKSSWYGDEKEDTAASRTSATEKGTPQGSSQRQPRPILQCLLFRCVADKHGSQTNRSELRHHSNPTHPYTYLLSLALL